MDNDLFFSELDLGNKKIWHSNIPEIKNGYIDNSTLAQLNTPRLNSFIRNLKLLCLQFGATDIEFENLIDNDSNNPYYFNDKGVLIDGKIIYYEDVYSTLKEEFKLTDFERVELNFNTD